MMGTFGCPFFFIDGHSNQQVSLCYNLPMALTIEEVRNIAYLARLYLSDDEEQRFAGQLSAILEYAEVLNNVDTSQISPTATVLSLTAPLRPDKVRPCPPQEKILENAPTQEEGMFQVPPVLE